MGCGRGRESQRVSKRLWEEGRGDNRERTGNLYGKYHSPEAEPQQFYCCGFPLYLWPRPIFTTY